MPLLTTLAGNALKAFGFSRGGAPADYELIATANGTGSSGVIDFQSIAQTYKHLQIRYTAKNSSTNANINVTFNNVTTASYARHSLGTDGATVSNTNATSASNISLINAMALSTTANSYSGGIIEIPDYSSTVKNKTLKANYGVADASRVVYSTTGFLDSTTAVSRVTLTASAGNFTTASRFSLYGIKG